MPTALRAPERHELQPILQAAHDFAARAPEWYQETPRFPAQAINWLRSHGLLAVGLRESGLDLGAGRTLELLEILKCVGYGDLSTGRLFEGHVNALQLVNRFGTPAQQEALAADVVNRGMLAAVWNTDDGSPLELHPEGDGYRLEGAKSFASGADNIDRPLITAQWPDGRRQLVLVPVEAATTRVEQGWWNPIGMEASESVLVDFTGTMLDASALIGAPDDYLRQPWFFGGAIRFAAVQLGGAEALFDEARRILQRLERTGDPYQRQRAGQAAILVENGNHWLLGAAERFDAAGPAGLECEAELLVAYVHMARSAIERICLDVMELCVRSIGAQGLARAGRFQRIVRDLNLYLRQPAPDAALAAVGAFALESPAGAIDLWRLGGDALASSPSPNGHSD